MPNRFNATQIRAMLVGLVAAASLAGCVVTPVGVRAGVYVGPGYGPPPPVADVVIGVAPAPGYIWTAGYWNWVGGRYVWRPGRWLAPRPGYRWANAHWARGPRGWRFVGGHWRR